MAESNGNGWRQYVPIIIAVVPLLVMGGRLLNRVDNLEAILKERGEEINNRFDQAIEGANARWMARDRQAESGDQRIRALAETLIAQQRDFIAMAGTDSRQDEAIKGMLGRMERLIERFNAVERELRPYQLPGPQRHGQE